VNKSRDKIHFNNLKSINIDEKVVYCKNCTMSNQRPRIQFNDDGVCSACVYHDYKTNYIDWDKREKELEELCDKHRKEDGSWDVIVPSSGGKGGSFIVDFLKEKFGMHPLTVTFAPTIPTEIGQENLFNISYNGFDNILFSLEGITHKKLSKISLEEFGHIFLPFAYGQMNIPLQISVKFNIPFIMFGEKGDLEYGGNLSEWDSPILKISSDTLNDKINGLPRPIATSDLSKSNWLPEGLKIEDLKSYMPPTKNELEKNNVREYYFSYFNNWKPNEHFKIAEEKYGFKKNNTRIEGTYTKYSGLDDKLNGFHYYLMFIKQGIGRATLDTSRHIRQGIISRDEGVDLVREYDGEFPSKHLELFLEYMGITEEELNKIFDKFRRPIIWTKEKNDWKLRQQVTNL